MLGLVWIWIVGILAAALVGLGDHSCELRHFWPGVAGHRPLLARFQRDRAQSGLQINPGRVLRVAAPHPYPLPMQGQCMGRGD